MDLFVLKVVAIVVTAVDPTMWIGPIIGACVSRRWWVPPALGVANAVAAIVLVFSLLPLAVSPDDQDTFISDKVFAGILLGFIAFGIGALIRRRRKTIPAALPSSTDLKDPT